MFHFLNNTNAAIGNHRTLSCEVILNSIL